MLSELGLSQPANVFEALQSYGVLEFHADRIEAMRSNSELTAHQELLRIETATDELDESFRKLYSVYLKEQF